MIAVIDYGMGNLRSVQKALEKVGGNARLVRSAHELAGAEKIVFPGVAAFGDAMEQLRIQGLVEPIVSAVRAGTPYLGFCLGLQLLFEVGTEDGEHKGLGVLGGKVVRFDFSRGMGSLPVWVSPMCDTGILPVSGRDADVPSACDEGVSPSCRADIMSAHPEQQRRKNTEDAVDTTAPDAGKMPAGHADKMSATHEEPMPLRIPHMGWNQIRWTRDCPMLRGIENGSHVYFAHSYYPVPSDPSIIVTTTDYGGEFCSSVAKDNIFATQFHPEKSQAVGLKLLENFVRL